MNITVTQGLVLSFVCMLLYALVNIFFKMVAELNINPLLVTSTGMIFTGLFLIIRGGASNFALPAMKSFYTWLYGIAFLVEASLIIYLLKYISASDASILTRVSIFISLFISYKMFGRYSVNAWFGFPLIILGFIITIINIDAHSLQILLLIIAISIARNAEYFSIELNKVGYTTKNFLQDISVVGYIKAITATVLFTVMFSGAVISDYTGYQSILFPTLKEFADPNMFMLAAFHGIVLSTVISIVKFKSIQNVKVEIFMCVTAFTPLFTAIFELSAQELGLYDGQMRLDLTMLISNVLVIAGSVIIVFSKYYDPNIHERSMIARVKNIVVSATVFNNDDYHKTAEALGVSAKIIYNIVNTHESKLDISKEIAQTIKDNFSKNIAMSDPLTGLANRLQFTTQFKNLKSSQKTALLYLDLNKFKPINDNYGHNAGDIVLIEISRRLTELISKKGLVARLGGDEFAILINNIDKKEAKKLSKEIQKVVSVPILIEGIEEAVKVETSIGIAMLPKDSRNLETLISIADKNMFKDKENS